MTITHAIPAAVSILASIFILWRIFRCAHGWELVDKTEFPPQIETFMKNGGVQNVLGYLDKCQAQRMSLKTIVIVLRCTKCGAARIHKIQA